MLRMSKLTDYGTVVMTYLARNPNGIHTANEIADEVSVALIGVAEIGDAVCG